MTYIVPHRSKAHPAQLSKALKEKDHKSWSVGL